MRSSTWSKVTGAFVVCLLAFPACKSDEGGSSFGAILDDAIDFYCGCSAEAGLVPSVEQCVADAKEEFSNAAESMYFECLEEFANNTPSAKDSFDCALSAYADYQDCQQALGCDDLLGGGDEFECVDGMSTVPQDFVCDQYPDCADGSDEVDCTPFSCSDGQTIPMNDVCDGSSDCSDGADEEGCPVTCESAYEVSLEACPPLTEAEEEQFAANCNFEG